MTRFSRSSCIQRSVRARRRSVSVRARSRLLIAKLPQTGRTRERELAQCSLCALTRIGPQGVLRWRVVQEHREPSTRAHSAIP